MSKVTNQPNVAVKATQHAVQAKPAAAAKPAPATPELNERAMRRTGKASGFTKSFTPLPSGAGNQVVSDAPTMKAGSAATMQQLRGGEMPTKLADIEAAEGRAACNADNLKPWTMAELKKSPREFLKNVVQLDGTTRSTADRQACGETSLLIGMIAGKPESIQQLASKLIDAKGNFTAAGNEYASKIGASGADELKDALTRLREGKEFMPADVTTLANAIQGSGKLAGAAPEDISAYAKKIEDLGVTLPAMQLQLFGSEDPKKAMGHWRVVAQGTQFNPWPNEQGQSSQIPASKGVAAGKADGAGWTLRDTVNVGTKK
ncbi:MAG: hypothetical protein QM817_17260 [Archangium sp.]